MYINCDVNMVEMPQSQINLTCRKFILHFLQLFRHNENITSLVKHSKYALAMGIYLYVNLELDF